MVNLWEKLDVAVVGNAGIDTAIFLNQPTINWEQETNFSENQDYVGQSGGFVCRSYAQLGYKTTFIGALGDDWQGDYIRRTLVDDGVTISGVFTDPAGTNRSVNLIYSDGTRHSFYDGKSHMELQPDMEKCRQQLRSAKFAHFSLPNWARYLLPIARQLGLPIACDIQDVTELDDPYRQEFVKHADFLFFSATNFPNPTPLIQHYLDSKREQIIVVGMGEKGCALGTNAGIQFFPPVPMDLPVVDSTGAGDGLAVGFLSSYLLEGYSLPDAIRRGQIVARYCCTQRANSSQLIHREQLERFYVSKTEL